MVIFKYFRGKGLGKEENGRVKPVQVDQKQNVKGIGFGTEGAFEPWWDDLYTKTAIGTKIKSETKSKTKIKSKTKKKSVKEQKEIKKKIKKSEKNNEKKNLMKKDLKA